MLHKWTCSHIDIDDEEEDEEVEATTTTTARPVNCAGHMRAGRNRGRKTEPVNNSSLCLSLSVCLSASVCLCLSAKLFFFFPFFSSRKNVLIFFFTFGLVLCFSFVHFCLWEGPFYAQSILGKSNNNENEFKKGKERKHRKKERTDASDSFSANKLPE